MQIKLIYSRHKHALWDNCLRGISEHTGLWPDNRAFIIVPESIKADTERRYLENFGDSGLMMAEVLSFRRLAYRLFAEAGGLAVDYITPMGKSMLIQSLIRQHRNQLRRFARFADRPGYAAEVESVLGDFHRYDISAADLRQVSEQTDDPALCDKLFDFSFVYEKYLNSLQQRGLTDHDQDLDRLQMLLESQNQKLRFLDQTSVWIYGFGETRDLTEQEYRIIDGLLRRVPRLTISVCADVVLPSTQQPETGAIHLRHGRLTARHIISRYDAKVEQIQAAWPKYAYTVADWLLNDKADFSAAELSCLKKSIKLLRAVDLRQELSYTAGEIRRLISEEGYRYRDIAVAVCDLTSSQRLLRNVFREYDLESFVDVELKLSGTSLARYIQNLLLLCQPGERFDNLISLLRTGLSPASLEEVDEYENYCLACGLHRFNRFRRSDTYPADNQITVKMQEFKGLNIDPLLDFCSEFNRSGSISDRCFRLFDFLCGKMKIPERLEIQIADLKQLKEEHAALTLAQSWNTLNRLFEDMVLMFDSKPVSSAAFYNIISAGMAGSVSQTIPFGMDRIMIGDARQMYQHPCKVLFIVGAKQSNFPAVTGGEGLLRNSEREQLSVMSGKLFPNMGKHRLAEESFRVFALLTLAQDRLYISCPSLQDNPSVYQQRLFSLIEQETVLKNDGTVDMRVNSVRRAQRACRIFLQSSPDYPDEAEIRNIKALQVASDRLREYYPVKEISGSDPLEPDATSKLRLNASEVLGIIPERSTISVSRVQMYNACPYSHYAGYLLGLREREERRADPISSGTLLHALAEAAFTDLSDRLAAAGFMLRDLPADSTAVAEIFAGWQNSINRDYIDSLYRKAVLSTRLPLFADPVIFASTGRSLRKMAEVSLRRASTQVSPSEYMPLEQEWSFPADGVSPLTLNIKDRNLEFKGIIDRIDLHADKRHCRIIDYKSSRHEIDYNEIYYGLQLQLPVYLHAWLKTNPQLVAAAIGYFRFDNPGQNHAYSLAAPRIETNNNDPQDKDWLNLTELDGDRFGMLGRFAFSKVKDSLKQMFDGEAGAAPACIRGRSLPCEYCALQAMCQYDSRTISRQARVLAPVSLPADYPDADTLNRKQEKAETMTYLESLMEKEIDRIENAGANEQTAAENTQEMDRL
jgi:ATP-dependent helicase/nuclease subunit B